MARITGRFRARRGGLVVAAVLCAGIAQAAGPVDHSLRPLARPGMVMHPAPASASAFDAWATDFRRRAEALGIDRALIDRAFLGVSFDPAILKRDENQFQFTKTVGQFLKTAVSEARIRNGRAAMRKYAADLAAIEARYGVEKQIVAAIWGLESAYGAWRGSTDVLSALATLAATSRRGAFFETQLIAALTILQRGEARATDLRGSWAGAMGHTQFMPTSYLQYAEDFDGDGRRDIWSDDPRDALASTAAYLAAHGWTHGQPWGVEVRLPEDFDYLLADRRIEKMPSDWAALGVRGIDGQPVPDHAPASILLPGGHRGPAFMIFPNFAVLERYNTADAYVIGVGHLGDRLMGAGPVGHPWPDDRALTYDERIELQRRLTERGFDTQGIDARIGPLTINAVRAFQNAQELIPDGYPSPALLARLRGAGG
ncbi:lytic murein transglycosylase [Jhaorihella thermophila]|uniref:Lytic murein transglycosylase n=1 Tax=Jhaorihella thermophila TaxID=488547 RepID=A0A1H5V9E5_9RHOB|nr:lytic murein transglycosylase [Jhaorihella thermophila]